MYAFHECTPFSAVLMMLAVAHAGDWWSPGDPVPDARAVVSVGSATFTVLTPAVIRIEFANVNSTDIQTTVAWQRKLEVPSFSVTRLSPGVVITTNILNLTYSGGGSMPFSSGDLRVEFLTSIHEPWTPEQTPELDPGNLGGTFHTLDRVGGWPGLNCSLLDPLYLQADVLSYYPCVPGLVSTSGWSLLDDSRSPVMTDDWLAPRRDGTCSPNASRTSCILGQWNIADEAACEAAGCCWSFVPPAPSLLNLYFSASREDHFTDTTCAGCAGSDYVLERPQGYAFSDASEPGTVPLNLYWNPAPGSKQGTTGDNVVSTTPPTQAGYTFVRVQGYIYNVTGPQPNNAHVVKLWYSSSKLDHFTTASAVDEAEASAGGYSFVADLGYIILPSTLPTQAPAGPSCFQRSGSIDWYFFGHGTNYSSALADFVAISGPIPIPRKHWLGMSWSRWGNEIVQEVMIQEVENLTAASFPLSTYILDMNWHLKPDWTGYSWDRVAYPNHTGMLAWMHSLGLATAVNLHDAEGVMSFEDAYAAMAVANGIDPSTQDTVAFHISNKTFADALHNIVLKPLAVDGIDFYWTDWQQGLPGVQSLPGVTPTWLLNAYRFQNSSQPGSSVRGLTHSRFGGWGSHRFPTAFGGDVIQEWSSLAFMIYFTATATNVGMCYWGHEMMRNGGGPDDDTELFVRVMQFGAWSPIFTNWGNGGQDDNLWATDPASMAAMQAALADRAQLLPYRYTLSKVAYDTGLGPLRPMYYNWPLAAASYASPGQYMVGTDILVAPVSSPAPATGGEATVSIWMPPNTLWLDWNEPALAYAGVVGTGTWYNLTYPLARVPAFVRAAALIPMTPYATAIAVGAAARDYAALQLDVYPDVTTANGPASAVFPPLPGTQASAWVYEDDGISNGYTAGAWANTSCTYSVDTFYHEGTLGFTCLTLTISTQGSYAQMPSVRDYSVWFKAATAAPQTATVDGANLAQSAADGVPGSWYMANGTATTDLRIYFAAALPVNVLHTLVVCW